MKPNKITNRTQVYRAVYYSGFEWERKRIESGDIYTIKSKKDDFVATLEHLPSGDLTDIITIKSDFEPSKENVLKLTRLLKKIQRRTKNIKFEQSLVDLDGQKIETVIE